MKKKRVLLIACAMVLLCMSMVIGITYGLYTQSLTTGNHLKAGNLDISLIRTDLSYCVLNEEGELAVTRVEEDRDFTASTDENIFGMDASGLRIAPGAWFDAEMKVVNNGNVAFTYDVGIRLQGSANALAEQLRFTVTYPDGTVTEKLLSEMTEEFSVASGKMKVTDNAQTFRVRVDFLDDVKENANRPDGDAPMDNDLAQSQSVAFDMFVTAVQSTGEN